MQVVDTDILEMRSKRRRQGELRPTRRAALDLEVEETQWPDTAERLHRRLTRSEARPQRRQRPLALSRREETFTEPRRALQSPREPRELHSVDSDTDDHALLLDGD